MTFDFINLASKTFWLGLAMVIGGILKLIGVDIPVITDLIVSFWPNMDGGMLVSAGLGMMFVREAVEKVSA